VRPSEPIGSPRAGYTFIEMIAVMAIIGVLASIAIPRLQDSINRAKVARAIGDINAMQNEITGFASTADSLPASLAAVGRAGQLDPWGNPYIYYRFPTGSTAGARLDRFSVPLNAQFDLYSMGEDAASSLPLSAGASLDDVVRANDGGYIGLGSTY